MVRPERGSSMYTVVRQYTGAAQLVEAMRQKEGEVRDLLSSISGFVAYYAVQTDDGVATITVCEDKSGTDESVRRAGEWVRQNLAGGSISPPQVVSGEVYISFTR